VRSWLPLLSMLLVLAPAQLVISADNISVAFKDLTESSGLAFSTRSDQILFSHNDSGDSARLFAFDREGKSICELKVTDAGSQDWEDLCSFEHDGENWLAIGDTGDNDKQRNSVRIYLLKEPKLTADDGRQKTAVDLELKITYPQGAVDCEALAYDPLSQAMVLFSKEAFNCGVYRVDLPQKMKGKAEVQAKFVHRLAIPMVTAADISRDGLQLVIGTYGPACLLDRRHEDLDSAWRYRDQEVSERYLAVPHRKQGESVCFSPAGTHIWLTSEFRPTPLYEVKLPNQATSSLRR
jgi:hypothetical protein